METVIWVSQVLRLTVTLRQPAADAVSAIWLRQFRAFCGGFGDSAFAVFSVEPAFGFASVFFEFCHQAGTDAACIRVFYLLFKALFEFVECDGGTVAAEFSELGQRTCFLGDGQKVVQLALWFSQIQTKSVGWQ